MDLDTLIDGFGGIDNFHHMLDENRGLITIQWGQLWPEEKASDWGVYISEYLGIE